MLQLLRVPCWAAPGQPVQRVPATVPGCLLIHLAVEATWIDRERLAERFWPGDAPGEALRKLRVNLHRVRELLQAWGCTDALAAERHRVCLTLPCDVHGALRGPRPDGTLPWLQGFRFPGFEGFWTWADEVAARLAARPAPHTAAAPGGPVDLPGRQAEQAALRADTAAAVVLRAEPGGGKTALLRASFPTAPWLQGREGQHGVPFGPLLEWLRDHPERWRDALRARPALTAYRLDLARLLPELLDDEPLPPLDAHTAKARLLEALTRLFEHAGPLLVVDDLQWLDGATLEWLGFVAHRGRLRWRAGARRQTLPPVVAELCRALATAGRLSEHELPPLSRAAVEHACRQRWPLRVWTGAQIDRLHRASAGNPFVLGELVAMGTVAADDSPVVLPRRVIDLVQRHLQTLSPAGRAAVDAAAVLARPAPLPQLCAVAAPDDEAAFVRGCDEALAADVLLTGPAGLQCRHDLIREGALQALPPARRAWLHGRAAEQLQQLPHVDPLTVAAHCDAAGDRAQALPWLMRAAGQQKDRGRFGDAQALWRRVADEAADPALALRARLAIADADLLHDLAQGSQALQAVMHQARQLDDAAARDEIEAHALSALVDNTVFAGDLAQAEAWAALLRERLPRLQGEQLLHALEVLIELAMRQPDIDAAWACLAQMRAHAPRRPSLPLYEGQIHWFAGHPRGARDALQAMLATHPDFCRGLTIENDLAVMLNALGDLDGAERMARRSLDSWRGVPHTQTLSLLVLGSTLGSQGRLDEARAALDEALALARAQGSPGFEAEARVRRARLALLAQDAPAALADLDAAGPLLAGSTEPLRVSQFELYRTLALAALGRSLPTDAVPRLQRLTSRSAHPLLHTRLLRIRAEQAWAAGDADAARHLDQQALDLARDSGVAEPALPAERALSARLQPAGR